MHDCLREVLRSLRLTVVAVNKEWGNPYFVKVQRVRNESGKKMEIKNKK